ncbi:hypothetical protein EJ03DRAFT_330379 [Teratosphaeria nubilosa]|uniref:Uncharacterized protein n=1 Tax=Teratosphaeria nubilosa TaxID=161662 RepID=A0A6G1KZK9_9PEZI|nr:hypothetical protein EJ03DRAFT_330379 [Teratosphaeria nubilosa]
MLGLAAFGFFGPVAIASHADCYYSTNQYAGPRSCDSYYQQHGVRTPSWRRIFSCPLCLKRSTPPAVTLKRHVKIRRFEKVYKLDERLSQEFMLLLPPTGSSAARGSRSKLALQKFLSLFRRRSYKDKGDNAMVGQSAEATVAVKALSINGVIGRSALPV